MKKITGIVAFLLCFAVLAACNPTAENEQKISILYIGNSFVHTGKVPKQVSVLVKLYGVDCAYKDISKGGASLADQMDAAIREMNKKQYDYVVIQDYGTRPGSKEFFADVEALCNKTHETGATPVLYNPLG